MRDKVELGEIRQEGIRRNSSEERHKENRKNDRRTGQQ